METYVINDTTLEFPGIVYVGGSGSSDSTGDGTSGSPVATVSKALDMIPNGGAIKLGAGTFNFDTVTITKNVSFIGEKLNTIISGGNILAGTGGYLVKFYQLSIDVQQIFREPSVGLYTEAHNCLIKALWSLWGYATSRPNSETDPIDSHFIFNSCVIDAYESTYVNGVRYPGQYNDCVIFHSTVMSDYGGDRIFQRCWSNSEYFPYVKTTSILGTVDKTNYYVDTSTYRLDPGFESANSNVGLYSGEFGWDGATEVGNPFNKFLIIKDDGTPCTVDVGTIKELTDVTEVVPETFEAHGFDSIDLLTPIHIFELSNSTNSIEIRLLSNVGIGEGKSLNVVRHPHPQIALPSSLSSLDGVYSVDSVNVIADENVGLVRFAFVRDDGECHVFKDGAWGSLGLLLTDAASADILISSGMSKAEVEALTSTELNDFYSESTGYGLAVGLSTEANAKVINVTSIDFNVSRLN